MQDILMHFTQNVRISTEIQILIMGMDAIHEAQKEKENKQGKCFCWSCPLGYPADEESLQDPNIEWLDGKPEANSMEEDSYIILV